MNDESRPKAAPDSGWLAEGKSSGFLRQEPPATTRLLTCELCLRPAPLLYDVWQLVAAVCAVCEPSAREPVAA